MASQIPRRRRMTTATTPVRADIVVRPTRASVLRAQKNQRSGSITSRPSEAAISCSSDSLYSSLRSVRSVQSVRSNFSVRSSDLISLPPSPPDLPPVLPHKSGSPDLSDSPLLRDGPPSASRPRAVPPPPSSALLRRYAAPAPPFIKKAHSATRPRIAFPNSSTRSTPKRGGDWIWKGNSPLDRGSSPAGISEEPKPLSIAKRENFLKAVTSAIIEESNPVRLTKSAVATLICTGEPPRPLVKSKLIVFGGAAPKRVKLTHTKKGLAICVPKLTRLVISSTQQTSMNPRHRTLSSSKTQVLTSRGPRAPRLLTVSEAAQVNIRGSHSSTNQFQRCLVTQVEHIGPSPPRLTTMNPPSTNFSPSIVADTGIQTVIPSGETILRTTSNVMAVIDPDHHRQACLLQVGKMEENYSLHFAKRTLGVSISDSIEVTETNNVPPRMVTAPPSASSTSYADILSPRVVEKVHLQGCNWLFARWASRAHSR